MILLDLSQVMIANLMTQVSTKPTEINENMIRHMVLNSIRYYRQKFSPEYGELVICADGSNSWRRSVFPHYKANRKKHRDESPLDWSTIFTSLNRIRDELREFFPYRTIHIDRAEADDIIAVLCHEYGVYQKDDQSEPILILSGDKDFVQLQKFANVQQYSPVQKKFFPVDNPARHLRMHILGGDRGDGIPNFLSPDDCFVAGKRQKPITTKKLEEWGLMEPELFCDAEMLRGYRRNETLIDLSKIPNSLRALILSEYEKPIAPERSGLLKYFTDHRLTQLTERIGEF